MKENGAGKAHSVNGHAGQNGTGTGHPSEYKIGHAMKADDNKDRLTADFRDLVEEVITPRFSELDDRVTSQSKATDGKITKLDAKVGKLSRAMTTNARAVETKLDVGITAIRNEMQAHVVQILAALASKS